MTDTIAARRPLTRQLTTLLGAGLLSLSLMATTAAQTAAAVTDAPVLPSWPARLQQVVERHPQVRAAASEVLQQDAQVELARSAWRPQVRAGLSTGRAQTGSNSQAASLNASQLLYDFGRQDGRIDEASAQREQRVAKLLQAVDDAALEAGIVLIDLERQSALLVEARRLTEALDEVVKLTRLRAQAGAATLVDPTIAQARRDGAELTELSIRARLEQAQGRWQTLSGETSAAGPQVGAWPIDFGLSGEDPGAGLPDPRRFDEAPAVLQARREVDAARAALEVARAGRLPSVTLDASVGRPLERPLLQTSRNDASLTLNLNAPVYQGGASEAQVRSALAALQAAQERQEVARRAVSERWREADLQLRATLQRTPALAQRLLRYNESRRLYREQYLQLGTRSILDFLNAEQELYLSRTELLTAEYDARQSKLQALHAAGELRSFFDLRPAVQSSAVRP